MIDIKIEEHKRYMTEEYTDHPIFETLIEINEFYEFLSDMSFRFPQLIKLRLNIDSHIHSSIGGTIESIYCILKIGRINDAYSLTRKYNDAIVTDICKSLMMKKDEKLLGESISDGTSFNPFDTKVNKWVNEKVKLEADIDKVRKSPELLHINEFFDLTKEGLYIKGRQLCNDNSHYNSLSFFVLNDNDLDLGINVRIQYLNKLMAFVKESFVLHFSYIWVLHPEYFTSTDYVESLDCSCQPVEGSQNWVSSFAIEIFNKYIAPNKSLANFLKSCNFLEINNDQTKL